MANCEEDCTFDNIAAAIELLNVSIENATNNKNILASRLDRVISLKKEVELKENAAEEAKAEAATSSLEILAKVEVLKQSQRLIKEKTDKHARKVYTQKADLAKGLKELQLGMSGVLNKERRSLEVSDEMHKKLKRRLTKAVREKELAVTEKLKTEKLAAEALAFEQNEMSKLEKDSERLKQETVMVSKLSDLCKERESVVNILHGDVSDISQDINLFIERADQPVKKLCGLLSSSQTSTHLDSEEQKGKMNGSTEIKSAPVVATINELGHLVSNKSSVDSAQTRAAASLNVKHAVKKWKVKESAQRRIASAGEIYGG